MASNAEKFPFDDVIMGMFHFCIFALVAKKQSVGQKLKWEEMKLLYTALRLEIWYTSKSLDCIDLAFGFFTYPCRNFKYATIEIWEWMNNSFPHFTGQVIT